MSFKSIDHYGIVVESLDRSIPWNRFLQVEAFERKTWRAAELDDYVGRVVGYPDCDLSGVFWALPGGTVIEMLEYHNPAPGRVDMASYNVGNTHLCFETADIHGDYERLRGHAEFRSPEPVSLSGDLIGGPWSAICGIRMAYQSNLYSFPRKGCPFQGASPYANPDAAADTG